MREAQIPFLLWLPAAILLHAFTGGSAAQAAKTLSEKAELLAFSRAVRQDLRASLRIEVSLLGDETSLGKEVKPQAAPKPKPAEQDEATAPAQELPPPKPAQRPAVKKPPKPIPVKKPAPPKKKPPEPKKVVIPKLEPPKKKPAKVADKNKEKKNNKAPQKLELPKPDGRIAIINDPSTDKNQKDNPNAHRIADHANTVKDESMARFRSYDQNSSKPTGGGMPGPLGLTDPGNSHEDKRGFSTEVPGVGPSRSGSEDGPQDPSKEPIARSQQGDDSPQVEQPGKAAEAGVKALDGGTGPDNPADGASTTTDGSWSISPDASGDGRAKQRRRAGRKAVAAQQYIPGVSMPGLVPQKYSISAFALQDALGRAHLRREQEKARNTRLTRHRGSFKANQFQKYRAAIENYDPSVKPGNQTSLNAARVPFASYINKMHNRIHPIFADSFLGSLRKLDPSDKLSNMKLYAHVEMVLDGETGALLSAGVVKPSGVTAFEVAALSSIGSAAPFGKAPEVIVSPDGNVYVHWEFYRDPYYACTSKFARPYIIKKPTKKYRKHRPRRPPNTSKEQRRTARKGPLLPVRKSQ